MCVFNLNNFYVFQMYKNFVGTRIGVFVCHCGSNIAATVDVKKVVETVLAEPGVVHAEDYQYMCSEAGQEIIAKAIKEMKRKLFTNFDL